MTKQRASKLKLPSDFLGTVQAFLNTPPPRKSKRKPKAKAKRLKAQVVGKPRVPK
jgi:hypothetical protein